MPKQDSEAKKNWFKRHKILSVIIGFFLFIIFVSAISGGGSDSSSGIKSTDTSDTPDAEIIKISAYDLYSAYEDNQIAADNLYEDQVLQVSGIIDSIGKDILDDPYVSIKAGNMLGSIQCMLDSSAVADAGSLTAGSSITMQGEKPSYLFNVLLRNCTIIK